MWVRPLWLSALHIYHRCTMKEFYFAWFAISHSSMKFVWDTNEAIDALRDRYGYTFIGWRKLPDLVLTVFKRSDPQALLRDTVRSPTDRKSYTTRTILFATEV